MSKTCLLIHIVFATKHRYHTIDYPQKPKLISYIKSIIKNKNCYPLEVNCMGDHVHILTDIRPSISLADLVKSIKQSTSTWVHGNPDFPKFDKWQEGYFAGSVGPDGVDRCRTYIKNQEHHHLGRNFYAEMERISRLYGLDFYEDDWE